MSGRALGILIVVVSLIGGAALYYTQVYAFYRSIDPESPAAEVDLTLRGTGDPEEIPVDDFQGIDADSSPVRFRACFKLAVPADTLAQKYQPYEKPVPLVAPGWFDCFDANAIGEALERGDATAFMGQENIHYGIDRVIAVFPDGRGYAWNQINHCGEVVFDGKPAPEGCPPAPENY
ncbi:MAG: DUF6446 family protein [Paracoccaceae bacterium]